MGGNRGCTHLCGLVVAMGQEIVHGWLTQKRSKKTPIPASLDDVKEKNYLIDSCRIWKKDGPKMKEMLQAIEKKANSLNRCNQIIRPHNIGGLPQTSV